MKKVSQNWVFCQVGLSGTLKENTHRGRCMLRLKVKEIAVQKGYNQSTLSRASDVPINTIRRIWRNPYYEVRLTTLNRIASVLGVPTTELFEDVPGTPNNE
jgi:transcriptional regulator with XRE-family HTH domain